MIDRYTRPEMGAIWSEENKYKSWLQVEVAACEAMAEQDLIPAEAARTISEKADFSVARIDEIEQEVRHDVIAFLTSVGEFVGPDSRFIHLGMTSSDVLDTALALQLKEAGELILDGIDRLLTVLENKAHQHRDCVMIGRSHGIHAEPITFGLKLAIWYDEIRRQRCRFLQALEDISVGKISGAVGTFANIAPVVEESVCRKLGLKPAPASSQIVQRDRHASFFTVLALLAGSIEKFATEIRHLQRTEVGEAEEFFHAGQKGSSAMPHKRNPILSENLCGLARLVRANALAAMENMSLWHERDISHSSVERVIAPDSTILIDFMLHRVTGVIDKLVVYPERMQENLQLTGGTFFSQGILLALARRGISREQAYRWVQRNAMKSFESGTSFKENLLEDGEVMAVLQPDEVENLFSVEHHLRQIPVIFDRVFGTKGVE
ncbi:MAG: adenylosuccinate lyase [Deltaproteobacteria bacterium]|nr:adenylosuccinate lyase [Candidatus Anaeroferrophillus wilburensis]MBN2890007.1 adenylosuccinate lyase [Deltaproteobacteria bacterium]